LRCRGDDTSLPNLGARGLLVLPFVLFINDGGHHVDVIIRVSFAPISRVCVVYITASRVLSRVDLVVVSGGGGVVYGTVSTVVDVVAVVGSLVAAAASIRCSSLAAAFFLVARRVVVSVVVKEELSRGGHLVGLPLWRAGWALAAGRGHAVGDCDGGGKRSDFSLLPLLLCLLILLIGYTFFLLSLVFTLVLLNLVFSLFLA
jgi:hypothetical protein